MRRRLRLTAALLPLVAGGCNPYAHLTEVGEGSPRSLECGDCHVAVYAEWSRSQHASSWVNERFVQTTDARRIESCLGCHAPETVFVDGAPDLRAYRVEEGVNCLACHFDGDVLAGPAPRSALVEPHPIAVERDLYLRSDLCGKCHEGTFREWEAAPMEEKRTCQDCHMEPVKRTLTQATGAFSKVLVAFEEEYEGRRHTFHADTMEGFEGAVEARLEDPRRDGDTTHVDLVLVDLLPHRIPTGDFGSRRALLEVEALDDAGAVVASSSWELYRELETALLPMEPRQFPLTLPNTAALVRVRLARQRNGTTRTILHEEDLLLP